MSKQGCHYPGDREAALIAYLYEEMSVDERRAFERHANDCVQCSDELQELSGVRGRLAAWTPPEPTWTTSWSAPSAPRPVVSAFPAWARAAAAVLVVGAGLGFANLRVSYSHDGFTVQTGWLSPAADRSAEPRVDQASAGAPLRAATDAAITRAELDAALEQLRVKMQTTAEQGSTNRVRALLAESERRQQNEIALQTAALYRDLQGQREADLTKIDYKFTAMNRELLGQREVQREVNNSMATLVRLTQQR
ncbi:MAG TPA: hypothetical protein VJP86_02140 [Vicinamibacterales bacterium]|jgi:hypothetical protein|nr:hypothetical protein [Vicinamibacterales bacterium]